MIGRAAGGGAYWPAVGQGDTQDGQAAAGTGRADLCPAACADPELAFGKLKIEYNTT